MRLPRSQRRARRRQQISPPPRRGINAFHYQLPPGPWSTLGQWAVDNYGIAGQEAFQQESFLGDFGRPLSPDYPYRAGEKIWVFRPVGDEPAVPIQLEVLAETEHYVAIDKPHGLACIPRGIHAAKTAVVAARRQLQNDELSCAHRLDLETAGVLLLVKKPEYRRAYQLLFQRKQVRKSYRGLTAGMGNYAAAGDHTVAGDCTVAGDDAVAARNYVAAGADLEVWMYRQPGNMQTLVSAEQPFAALAVSVVPAVDTRADSAVNMGNSSAVPRGRMRAALTRTRVRLLGELEKSADNVENFSDFWPLQWEISPYTGFTHQIRALFNYLQMPLLFDPLYPQLLPPEVAQARQLPLQLLAKELEFIDPYTGENTQIISARHLGVPGGE
ncbi:pseudouridine synthase [Arcanobacterium urinimassiliense]|uniref:pseudouridine synthase n=1 Tax=Arcanobacterium urinimassiliense TaxID=1871014 RepID=UPI001177584A|nr:pseudouridine synthase [Arcanobacterium urinimassiliense]